MTAIFELLVRNRFGGSAREGRDVQGGDVGRIALAGAAGADAVQGGHGCDGVDAAAPGYFAVAERHVALRVCLGGGAFGEGYSTLVVLAAGLHARDKACTKLAGNVGVGFAIDGLLTSGEDPSVGRFGLSERSRPDHRLPVSGAERWTTWRAVTGVQGQ